MFGTKKKKLEAAVTPEVDTRFSLTDAIVKGMRERRKHIRVHYPSVGAVGDLPIVEINSVSATPVNLSQGGVLTKLPCKDLVVGNEYAIKVIWRYGPLEFNHLGELLRINEDHFHFKFTKVDVRSFAEFSKSFSAGIQGAETRLAKGDEAPSYMLEFWKSLGPDKILFQKTSKGEVVDIYFSGYRITFNDERGLLREEQNEKKEWLLQPARQEAIDEILIFLTNIVEPSERIRALLDKIIKKHYTTQS